MTKTITTAAQIPDEALHAALLEFAKANVPVDVQQLLVHGYDKRNTAPHSLRNAIAAALTHLPAPCAVEVVKLDWVQYRDTWHCDKHHEYEITRWWLGEDQVEVGHFEVEILGADQFGSLDEAKAAAQDDFERRILSCVVTKPVDGSMTQEEIQLENLKQMAKYDGQVISFECREPYYLASCDNCGWVGSSELCGTDSFGDDSDVYCPRCQSSGADCGKVAERIACKPVDVAAVQSDLDARLKEAGMYTVEEVMAGTPVDKWRVHSGMDNLQFFGEWLELKAREYKVMTAGYDIGDKDKSDDLYEWSLAHSGAFHDVLVNFRAAIRGLSPAEPAPAGFDNADWFYRDNDPDDNGDTTHEAITHHPEYSVHLVHSSFRGASRYVFRAPTLDPSDDDDEVLDFETEEEAIAAAHERKIAIDALLAAPTSEPDRTALAQGGK